MNKASKKAIRKYCSEIRKWMTCSTNIKHAIFSEFKGRIYDYSYEHPDEELTVSVLGGQFGTPEYIAASFSSETDMRRLKKKARKYILYKILAFILAVFLALAVMIIIEAVAHSKHSITITVTPTSASACDLISED